MKIRYLALIFTLMIGMVLGYFLWQTAQEEETTIDMVYYNEQLQEIRQELQFGITPEEIETAHECSLIFVSEETYRSELNDAIKKGYVIIDYEEDGFIVGKLIWDRESRMYGQWKADMRSKGIWLCMAVLLLGYGILIVLYIQYIRPFRQMERFAAEVAKGNLDIPIPMRKHNTFGAFTESFDIMREELKTARENEYRANISKKELVAELSHDIKTPVAAIKATCEVMEVKEQNPDTLEKVRVIENKADTIDKLIGNMFHATMEELQALKVEVTEESSQLIPQIFQELKYYGEIQLINKMPECLVYMDKLRLEQVIDNIVNNAFKYAKTRVCVEFLERQEGIEIRIRDFGMGVPEEELVFVTEKFYRGSNARGEAGSGLGLYLTSVFMNQMKGGMECYNEDGFVVKLFLHKV